MKQSKLILSHSSTQLLNQGLLGYNITAMLHTSITLETISLWLFRVRVQCVLCSSPASKEFPRAVSQGQDANYYGRSYQGQDLARLTLEGTVALNGVCTAPGLPSFQDFNRPQQGNEQTKNQLKPTTLFPGNDIIVVLCVSPSCRVLKGGIRI